MFKPSPPASSRSLQSSSKAERPGFADTQFLHDESDVDYNGFAPTQMFGDEPQDLWLAELPDAAPVAPSLPRVPPVCGPASIRRAEAVAEIPSHDELMPAPWAMSSQMGAGSVAAPAAATPIRRLRATLQRLLPGDFYSVLPLFVCVSLAMALISAVLPMIDRP